MGTHKKHLVSIKTYNEYPKHIFLWRNKDIPGNYPRIIKYASLTSPKVCLFFVFFCVFPFSILIMIPKCFLFLLSDLIVKSYYLFFFMGSVLSTESHVHSLMWIVSQLINYHSFWLIAV